jgi:hypothetical protein
VRQAAGGFFPVQKADRSIQSTISSFGVKKPSQASVEVTIKKALKQAGQKDKLRISDASGQWQLAKNPHHNMWDTHFPSI